MSAHNIKILVLDANQRSALAVTRSLGKHAHLNIFTADETIEALAGHSRYSQQYFQHPSIYRDPNTFDRWLVDFIRTHKIDWVFPVTEVTSQSILQLREQLQPCRIPFADYATVMSLADKWQLIELARKVDVRHPNSQRFSNAAALNLTDTFQYPLVLKPCLSRVRLPDGWMDTAVHIVHDSQRLHRLLNEQEYFRDHPFILQEFIPGHGAGIFALYDRGKPITFFAHQRLREKPPAGGVSVLSQSAVPDPQMLAMARRLLDAAQWHGVAMVEFRVTPEGQPHLMEINTRFWGSLQLAIDAGVDFPYLLYRTCSGEDIAAINQYRIGQRLRWLLGDVDSLYLMLRDRKALSNAAKLQRLLQFFIPHPFITKHEINRWQDLRPALFELRQYLKHLFG